MYMYKNKKNRYGAIVVIVLLIMSFGGGTSLFADIKTATFAGGCFWCTESDFDKVPGVISTTSGYTGGTLANPSYRQVTGGRTGHLEAVQIEYDDDAISYAELLEIFWRSVDPLDFGGQFCDRGASYRTAIFYHDSEQRRLADASKQRLAQSDRFDRPLATPIRRLDRFYDAEEYHQDYHTKNPSRYRFYRFACGRDARLDQLWGQS